VSVYITLASGERREGRARHDPVSGQRDQKKRGGEEGSHPTSFQEKGKEEGLLRPNPSGKNGKGQLLSLGQITASLHFGKRGNSNNSAKP